MRNAVELFASFIDEETYCLFYYNGHAVGHAEDIYLAPVESSLDEHDPTPLSQVHMSFWRKGCVIFNFSWISYFNDLKSTYRDT